MPTVRERKPCREAGSAGMPTGKGKQGCQGAANRDRNKHKELQGQLKDNNGYARRVQQGRRTRRKA